MAQDHEPGTNRMLLGEMSREPQNRMHPAIEGVGKLRQEPGDLFQLALAGALRAAARLVQLGSREIECRHQNARLRGVIERGRLLPGAPYPCHAVLAVQIGIEIGIAVREACRSEERRVGKESRSRWSP